METGNGIEIEEHCHVASFHACLTPEIRRAVGDGGIGGVGC